MHLALLFCGVCEKGVPLVRTCGVYLWSVREGCPSRSYETKLLLQLLDERQAETGLAFVEYWLPWQPGGGLEGVS